MTLPLAMLLSEWQENQKELKANPDIENEQPPHKLPQHVVTNKEIPLKSRKNGGLLPRFYNGQTEQAQHQVHERKKDYKLGSIMKALDCLLRPSQKLAKCIPQIGIKQAKPDLPPASTQKLKCRKTPLSNSHPYPLNSGGDVDPHLSQSFVSVPGESGSHAAPKFLKSTRLEIGKLCSKSVMVQTDHSDLPKNLYDRQIVLGQGILFEGVENLSPSRPRRKRNRIRALKYDISETKCEKKPEIPKKLVVDDPLPKASKKVAPSYCPIPAVYTTEITLELKETNFKLNYIVKGMSLNIMSPFDYFDDVVFSQEIIIHKTLYASTLSFKERKQTEENVEKLDEKSSGEIKKSQLLTCDQLEKALTSKLSVHAPPFNYNPPNQTPGITRWTPHSKMEAYVEFLSHISDITMRSLTHSDAGSQTDSQADLQAACSHARSHAGLHADFHADQHAGKCSNFANSLLASSIKAQEKVTTSTHTEKENPFVNDLEGQQLTPEEEEKGNAAHRAPIGAELRRSTDNIANKKDPVIMFGCRDILELGLNLKDQWKEVNRWVIGPSSNKDKDKHDKDYNGKLKKCPECSFEYPQE